MKTNILDIFCIVDDFSMLFNRAIKEKSIEKDGKKHINRKSRLSDGEVMTILILFNLSRYLDLKAFYLQYIIHSCRPEFPHLVSYNRFVELQSKVGYKLIAFLNMCCLGECIGISFINSNSLRTWHVKHKTMKGLAQKEKCTMGWFYGFKLHIVINDKGEIIQHQITLGNCDDR